MTQTAIARINALNRADFNALLGPLYEHSPWAADGAFDHRPFADADALLAALRATVDQASGDARMSLVRAHPELAGERVRTKALTDASMSEQASAGLDQLSETEIAEWARLNAAYRAQYDFPFIICVRLHTKEEILAALSRRLSSTRARELQEAIQQIHAIARLRLTETLDRLDRNGLQSERG